MPMEQARFEALVARMERFAAARPAAYRRRVLGLALIGYGYLAVVVLVLLGLLVAEILYFKGAAGILFFAIGAPLVLVLRSMWFRFEPPPGEHPTREAAPEFFQLLDGLQRRLKTPVLHEVVITPDFNAGIMQAPRLGLLGWHRNYLVIGLPLMKALTVEQFHAALAHELGHLSRGHARAANWIYRLRLIWLRLESTFAQSPQWGSGLIRAFLNWYIPYFNAASFPLARANEYEADAASVQLTTARNTSQALTGVGVIGRYLSQRYWPMIHALAKESPEPIDAPFAGFVAAAVRDVSAGELRGWQDAALAAKTSCADTHPSLADRLKAIGAEAEFAPPGPGESAEQLLGTERERIGSAFDAQWRSRVAQSWKTLHENTRTNRARLTELRSQAAAGELTEREDLEFAHLEENVGTGSEAALSLRRSLIAKYPQSMLVRFALAAQLLQNGDAEGVAPMESVIANDDNALLAGAELLRNYYWRRDGRSLAAQWNERFVGRSNLLQAAQRERGRFLLSDSVRAHGLSSETIAQMVAQLKMVPNVHRAYLVRKLTIHFPNKPLYVLGFRCNKGWVLSDNARATATAALQAIRDQVKFNEPTMIVNLDASKARFAKKLRRVKGSRIV